MAGSPHLLSRIVGALIGGGGGYLALTIGGFELEQPIVLAIAGGLAIAGFALGAKVWEAIASLA